MKPTSLSLSTRCWFHTLLKQKLLCCRLSSWQYSKSPNRPSVNQSFRGSRFGSRWVPVRFALRSPSHNCFASLFLGHCRMFCGQMSGSAIVSRAPTRTQIDASSNLHLTCYIFPIKRYMFYTQSTQLHLKNNKRTKKGVKRTRRTALIRSLLSFDGSHFILLHILHVSQLVKQISTKSTNAPAITNSSISPCLRSQTLRIKLYASSALSTSQVLHSLTFQAHLQAQCCIPWSIRVSPSQVLH